MVAVLRRAGFYLLALWAAVTVNFVVPRLMPGDPATALVGRLQGKLDAAALEALRTSFGLSDAPWWRQYLDYLGAVARGDLGVSIAFFPAPVTEVVGGALAWTVLLAGTATLLSFVIGSALGVLVAWRRSGRLDAWLPPLLVLLGAFPYFWLAMLAVHVLGFELGWFPVRHAYDASVSPGWTWAFLASAVRHAVLPALTLVVATVGSWTLGMRSVALGVLGEPWLDHAHARGLPPSRIAWAYVARNALLPQLAGFGMALGYVLGGALLTEVVFAWPGTGHLMLQAVRAQDQALLQGLFLAVSVGVIGANALVDGLTAWLDPRVRRAA
ncbi:MAG: ABC transporter permease [Alphaproteobacteria bacterium]|nr:ABC transporter permease [Alphaproteobacteria bacterium]